MYNFFENQNQDITCENLPLNFVKQYLRVDHNFDDVEINVAIMSAQSYVRNYIKAPKDAILDKELIIPILTLIAHFYENKTTTMKTTERLDAVFNSVLNLHRRDIV